MSSVGNVNGYDAAQVALWRQQQEQAGTSSVGRNRPMGTPPSKEEGAERIWSGLTERAAALGMDTEQVAKLQEKVTDAIMQALDETETGSDPRAAVQDAILSTLQENGVDTTALQADMEAHKNGPPPGAGGPPPGGGPHGVGGVQDADGDQDADGVQDTDNDSTAARTIAANASTQRSTLLQQLMQYFPLLDEQA